MKPFLTVGMATYKDYDGVFFTLQALSLYHDLSDVELVVVDNAPSRCKHTEKAVRELRGTYVHWTERVGTAPPRDHLFSLGTAPYVLCLDSHVLLVPGALDALKQHYRDNPETSDLLQGPLLYDHHRSFATHWRPVWGSDLMYGTWAQHPAGQKEEPFEIPLMGLGLFSMRRAAWPGFNPLFRGFGGEEGYIHEKVRQRGGRCLCLPKLKWVHRFNDDRPVPHSPKLADKLRNYLIGWRELGLDIGEIRTAYAKHAALFDKTLAEVDRLPIPVAAEAPEDAISSQGTTITEPEIEQPPQAIVAPTQTVTVLDPLPPLPPPPPSAVGLPRVAEPPRKQTAGVLAIWCSHWRQPEPLVTTATNLLVSAKRVAEAADRPVQLRACVWKHDRIRLLPPEFARHIAHQQHTTHAGICMQLLRGIYEQEKSGKIPAYVAIVEHDVLYADAYFQRIADLLDAPQNFQYRALLNTSYIGLCEKGWQRQRIAQQPLHQMTFRWDYAKENFERVLRGCILEGAMNLEPPPREWKRILQLPVMEDAPSVHVNFGSHFTSHHRTFQAEAYATEHPFWGSHAPYWCGE